MLSPSVRCGASAGRKRRASPTVGPARSTGAPRTDVSSPNDSPPVPSGPATNRTTAWCSPAPTGPPSHPNGPHGSSPARSTPPACPNRRPGAPTHLGHPRAACRRAHQGRLTTHRSRRSGGDPAGLRPRARRRRRHRRRAHGYRQPRRPLSTSRHEYRPARTRCHDPYGVKMVSRPRKTPPTPVGGVPSILQ
jgi:hypothetical protein